MNVEINHEKETLSEALGVDLKMLEKKIQEHNSQHHFASSSKFAERLQKIFTDEELLYLLLVDNALLRL